MNLPSNCTTSYGILIENWHSKCMQINAVFVLSKIIRTDLITLTTDHRVPAPKWAIMSEGAAPRWAPQLGDN